MSFWSFSNRLRPARRMLSGFRHGSLLQLSARRQRNDARRPGRSGRASGNHGSARRSARRVFNFPFIGWNCCQSAKLFWRRRNLARSGTDATEAMRRNARVALRKARPATRFRPRKRAAYAERSGISALSFGHRRGSGVPGLRHAHDGSRARSQGDQARLHHLPVQTVRAL